MKILSSQFSISKALVAYSIAAAVILTIVVSTGVYFQVDRSVGKIQESMIEQDIQEIRQAIHSFLNYRLTALSDMSKRPDITHGLLTPATSQAQLARYMKDLSLLGSTVQITLLDVHGEILHSSLAQPLFSYTHEIWLTELMTGRQNRYLGLSTNDRHWYWRIAVPVYVQSQPLGALVAEIQLTELADFHYIQNDLNYYQIELIHQGAVIGSFGPSLTGQINMLAMPDLNIDIAYRWNRDLLDWARNRIIIRLIVGIMGTAILFLLLSIALAKRLYIRPLQQLREHVHEFYTSSSHKPLPTNQQLDEISALAKDTDWLINQLHSREKALLETRDTLELRIQERTQELHSSREELRKLNETLEAEIHVRTNELEKTQSQLVMQEKMASVGQLAAGIAHELNNPINFVRTNFATLTDDFEDLLKMLKHYSEFIQLAEAEPSLHESLALVRNNEKNLHISYLQKDIPVLFKESERGFDRIAKIIQSMRDFSRSDQAGDFAWANINKGIEDTLTIAQNEYKYHADVTTDLGIIDEIYCSLEQLNQVFLNLIINSAHAIASAKHEAKGIISIKTWQHDKTVFCEIRDNGPGIAPEHRNRIFEPFYTTKAPGQGTGLGLSISYDIVVHKHHGTLQLDCPEEGGSVFTLSLPVGSQEDSAHDDH
ncbi:ATP-binding protein [Desulfosediminicola flagellatus]|uniref:sensor histidine kinase n=1 Tax=Desulfosediminicola flagellatus TaxID=2569541 RepID=UPI0010AD4C11|nr:ATP-binding protein [Desulfosediminicola flagellatus]